MKLYSRSLVAAAAVSLIATAALAEREPPKVTPRTIPPEAAAGVTRVDPVTVLAAKPAELRKQTYNFVQALTATSVKLDQVARWDQAVCVTVQGLPAAANAEVKARVEEVAGALKVGVLQGGCKPNVQIFFTDQPQPFLDRIADQDEKMLGYWHHTDREKLKTVTRPIQSWYVTGTAGDGGNVVGMQFAAKGVHAWNSGPTRPGTFGRQPHGWQPDDEDNVIPGSTGCGDRPAFTSCLTSEFEHVLIVIDTKRAGEQNSGVIADYVAMLALSQPKTLDGCNVLPSVIDLFSKGCTGANGEDGLTRSDVAYLSALYKMDLQSRKWGQMTDMAGRMAEMLLKADTTDRLTIQAAGR